MYSDGTALALEQFGLTKTAFFGRNALLGPRGMVSAVGRQFRSGSLFKNPQGNPLQQGAYHNPFGWMIPTIDFGRKGDGFLSRAGATAGTAMSVLQPLSMAHAGYQALTAPEEQRPEAIGRLTGSLLGGAAGGPFGMVGQMAGSMVGENAGAALGRHFTRSPDFPVSP